MYLIITSCMCFCTMKKKNSMFVFAEFHYAQGFGWKDIMWRWFCVQCD
jgi:hypothetical protein